MSLDIAIHGANGAPERQISIGENNHYRLMQALGGSCPLLARLSDCYEDAYFTYDELDRLANEAAAVRVRCQQDPRLVTFLGDLQELIAAARSARRG